MKRPLSLLFLLSLSCLCSCGPSSSSSLSEVTSEATSELTQESTASPVPSESESEKEKTPAKSNVFYQENEPENALERDIWIVVSTGDAYQKYGDEWFLTYDGARCGKIASFDDVDEDSFVGKAQGAFARTFFCSDIEFAASFTIIETSIKEGSHTCDIYPFTTHFRTHRGMSHTSAISDCYEGFTTENTEQYSWLDEKGRDRYYSTYWTFEHFVKNKNVTEQTVTKLGFSGHSPAAQTGTPYYPSWLGYLDLAKDGERAADKGMYTIDLPENEDGLTRCILRFSEDGRYLRSLTLSRKTDLSSATFEQREIIAFVFSSMNEDVSVTIPDTILEKEAALMKEVGYFQD